MNVDLKKAALTVVATLAMGHIAMANEDQALASTSDEASIQATAEELLEMTTINEESEMSDDALNQIAAEEATEYMDDEGNVVEGSALGGIIGAEAADRWHRRVHPGHPRRGKIVIPIRRGRGKVVVPIRRYATCYAQSRNGRTFRASAWNARTAQKQALYKCIRAAKYCRALGCR